MSPRSVGAIQVAISAACFGLMAILAKFAYRDGVDVLALLLLRFGIAALVMLPVLRVKGIAWPRQRAFALLALMGGIGYVSQSFSFFSALHYAPAALVALLLYLHPFIVMLAGALLFGEALTRIRLVCVLTALAGTALVIGADISGQTLGFVFGLAAALIYAGYLLVGQRVMRTEHPMAAATIVMVSAALVFGLIALIRAPHFPSTLVGWSAAIGIALLSTVLSLVLLFAGIRRLGAADAATISTLEPVVTAALGVLVLGERLSPVQLAGGMLVLVAVAALTRWGGGRSRLRVGN